MINWFRKKLGLHICESWTEWKFYEASGSTIPIVGKTLFESMRCTVTRAWKERTCVVCGKVEWKNIKTCLLFKDKL